MLSWLVNEAQANSRAEMTLHRAQIKGSGVGQIEASSDLLQLNGLA